MTIGFVQPGTSRGMLLMMIGSRKMTPPRMLRIVPLGERYMRLRPNSSTRASSGVIVAHLTPTPYRLIAWAASTVIWSSVASRLLDAEVVVLQVDVEVGQDQLLLDERPDDARHLVAVELDDGVIDLELRHQRSLTSACLARTASAASLRPANSARSASPRRPCGCRRLAELGLNTEVDTLDAVLTVDPCAHRHDRTGVVVHRLGHPGGSR